jgi:ribonuclease HII
MVAAMDQPAEDAPTWRPKSLTPNRPTRAIRPGVERERAFWDAGMELVAGVDEVGRGALAGPLVAAAVILPPCAGATLGALRRRLAGARDSKTLAPAERERLVEPIRAAALAVGVGVVESDELDAFGLAAANRLAMERAVLALGLAPDALLLDACTLDLGLPQVGAIDADAHCLSVAAASIIAKVARDAMMTAHHAADPRYAFAEHKGYGTALHLQRLVAHGPGPIHRRSFAPVADAARS